MKPAALAVVVVLLAASPAAMAQVEPPDPRIKSSRFVAALNLAGSVFGDRSATTTSGGHQPSDTVVRFGVLLGGEHRVSDRWWFGAAFGLSQWTQGAGIDAGYGYGRLDLGVAPRLELFRLPFRAVTTELHLAIPIGISKTFVEVPLRRAFSEQVDSAWGWYGGGTLSVTTLFHFRRRPRAALFGVRLDAGYLRHANGRTTTFTPVDAAQAPIVEETDIVDNDLLFMAAGVLAF